MASGTAENANVLAAPMNSDEGEAANAAQEKGSDGAKGGQRGAVRRPHLEDHDGDDDGEDAVAEGFETDFGHGAKIPESGGRQGSSREEQPSPSYDSWNIIQTLLRVFIGLVRSSSTYMALLDSAIPVSKLVDCIICDDALFALSGIPSGFVDSIVTSPPYYGQRDYSHPRQIGNEENYEKYIERLLCIFQECQRILKDRGTLWLNLGDKYQDGRLLGIPWQMALALQRAGWILRSDVIWWKPNAMPSSVKNRLTCDHEYLFFLTKGTEYYFDADAIREPHITFTAKSRMMGGRNHFGKQGGTPEKGKNGGNQNLHRARWDQAFHPKGRNKRTVWEVPLSKFPEAHFAVFPEKLIEPCILGGSPQGGVVLDPFVGSGTTAVVAIRNGRHYIGIDCNRKYCEMAERRIALVCTRFPFPVDH